ncbi:hypothetical protein DPMN_039548 [Dreissena polymorpha]|uniref:Uncharacterized protein n=1 Tax=Dreissena polymorpha TaxID=45954 RepID=A0A9D4CTF5_DREPO|nr:hypothetical protein DPMN_039548 [Dreissena polymorpha]
MSCLTKRLSPPPTWRLLPTCLAASGARSPSAARTCASTRSTAPWTARATTCSLRAGARPTPRCRGCYPRNTRMASTHPKVGPEVVFTTAFTCRVPASCPQSSFPPS